MHVNLHGDFDSLRPLSDAWNELGKGVPFLRWEWLEAWWRHYCCNADGQPKRDRSLFVLTVWDESNQLLAIAPWYRVSTLSGAKVIRFLGDGEVCSDYLTILCRPGEEDAVAEALADWLSIRNQTTGKYARSECITGNGRQTCLSPGDYRWDRLEFVGVVEDDLAVSRLLARFQADGNTVHYGSAPNIWRVSLPPSWEDFLLVLSKAHRNRLRRAEKLYLQSGKVQSHPVKTLDEFDSFYEILMDLHKRRWQLRGQQGCFVSPPFQAFHREIATCLFSQGRATLSWLELDGKPLAAEYRLHGDGVMYAYQCGMDPDRLSIKPGELSNMIAIKNAIDLGQHSYDLLRGDEPYKAHWRATPKPMLSVRVIPRHVSARLRHSAWVAGRGVKHWIKRRLQSTGRSTEKETEQESPTGKHQ
jgi:CelD/BcsL family acetyltransferase involved in cellulose biosynthesis